MKQAHARHDRKAERPKLVRPVGGRPQLGDDWRRWIAEQLLAGANPQQVTEALALQAVPPMVAKAEVEQAAASPYLQAAALLQRRVDKRDWLLGSYAKLAAIDPEFAEVPRRRDLSAEDFFRDYYAQHRPVLLQGLIDHWPAYKLWSLDHLEAAVGDAEIEVQTGRESNQGYELDKDRHRKRAPFSTLIGWLREDRASNDFYITANNCDGNRAALAPIWHEIGDIPGILAPSGGIDGFFWMGPRGTLTPFHHDLTNNLLIQIRGRKRVTMAPSWETPRMRNHRHCFSTLAGPADLERLAPTQRPQTIVCTIEQGEALFIPVGWWHHVEGLDMSISLSFTNFARPNDFFDGYRSYEAM